MTTDLLDSLYNFSCALEKMNSCQCGKDKYKHMLGFCDLMQNTLNEVKEDLKCKIEKY